MKVLVTGAGALLGQGIIRAIRLSPKAVHIVAVDPDPRAVGLYWADSAHLVPKVEHEEYESAVRELLELEGPDIVLVGTDVELPFFSRNRAALERDHGVSILVSDPSVVEIADDKWQTFGFLRDHGFSYPRSTLSLADRAFFDAVEYPLIVKPRRGARSVGLTLARTREQLEQAFLQLEDPIIQEHVGSSDDEYTAGALVFEGRFRGSIVMRRELRDGNTYRAYVAPYPRLNEEIGRLAEQLNPHGPVNFQFRVDEDELKVFEINARFSGTTPLRARAGFNEVDMCIQYLQTGDPGETQVVQPMVILRHWEETLVDRNAFEIMAAGTRVPEILDA